MRRGRFAADGLERRGWCEIAKGLTRSVVFEAVGEGVEEALQPVEAVVQVVRGVEES